MSKLINLVSWKTAWENRSLLNVWLSIFSVLNFLSFRYDLHIVPEIFNQWINIPFEPADLFEFIVLHNGIQFLEIVVFTIWHLLHKIRDDMTQGLIQESRSCLESLIDMSLEFCILHQEAFNNLLLFDNGMILHFVFIIVDFGCETLHVRLDLLIDLIF